jgi:hypothetical protein
LTPSLRLFRPFVRFTALAAAFLLSLVSVSKKTTESSFYLFLPRLLQAAQAFVTSNGTLVRRQAQATPASRRLRRDRSHVRTRAETVVVTPGRLKV